MQTKKGSSSTISKLMIVPKLTEPILKSTLKASGTGIFVGYSSIYNMPVFLDFNETINPHALIVSSS